MQNRKTNVGESKLSRAIAKEAQAERSLQKQRMKIKKLILAEHLQNDGRAAKLYDQEKRIRHKLHFLRINIKRQQFSLTNQEKKTAKVQNLLSELNEYELNLTRQLKAIQAGIHEYTNQFFQDIQGNQVNIANAG